MISSMAVMLTFTASNFLERLRWTFLPISIRAEFPLAYVLQCTMQSILRAIIPIRIAELCETRTALAIRSQVFLLCQRCSRKYLSSGRLSQTLTCTSDCAPTFGEYEMALRPTGCDIDFFTLSASEQFRVPARILDQITDDLSLLLLIPTIQPAARLILSFWFKSSSAAVRVGHWLILTNILEIFCWMHTHMKCVPGWTNTIVSSSFVHLPKCMPFRVCA